MAGNQKFGGGGLKGIAVETKEAADSVVPENEKMRVSTMARGCKAGRSSLSIDFENEFCDVLAHFAGCLLVAVILTAIYWLARRTAGTDAL